MVLPGSRRGAGRACWPSGCGWRLASGTFSGDQRVTMSFGVSASPHGGRFEYQRVFAEADEALFEAKRGGRDRVAQRRPAASRELWRRPSRPLPPGSEGTRVVRGGVEYQRLDDRLPERPTPFASLEATSRERLLAETAEAWYHFGDSRGRRAT